MVTPASITPAELAGLGQTPLFSGLQPAELSRICQAGQVQQVEKGSMFFLQGQAAGMLYALLAGSARLAQVNPDGQQVLLRAIGPFHLFGAVALAQNETYPVSAEAAEACRALAWPKSALMPFVGQYPQFALNAIQLMAAHAREFQDRFAQLATERVERRLARTLLRLAAQTGEKTPEGVRIHLSLTRQDLAEMTGTTLYTVSRLLSQWEGAGLISARRGDFLIRDPHGLVSLSED